MKTYAQICLERAEKHTGPCLINEVPKTWSQYNKCAICLEREIDFKNTSRTDVVELAKRLDKACAFLRSYNNMFGEACAQQLERPLE